MIVYNNKASTSRLILITDIYEIIIDGIYLRSTYAKSRITISILIKAIRILTLKTYDIGILA